MKEHKIEALVLEKFEEEGWKDCFIVEIKHDSTNKLSVFIDSDSSMSFDKCRKVSRHIEAVLDEELWMGEKYTLEVSSPGVGRPLKLPRQYVKNIGRNLAIRLTDDKKDEGELKSVEENGITIEKQVVIKEGKKKRKEMVSVAIAFEEIAEAKVKISFKKK